MRPPVQGQGAHRARKGELGRARNLLPPTGIPRTSAVDCLEIRQGFSNGGVPSGALVDEHLRMCAHCRELFEQHAALGRRLASAAVEPASVTPTQLAATLALLEKEHGWRAFLRSRPTRARWLLSLAVPAFFVTRELLRQRVPWRNLGTRRTLIGLALLGFLGLVEMIALRPLPIARSAARVRTALAVLAWCIPGLLWFVPEAQASAAEPATDFTCRALACFAYGSALAAPSFALLWAFDRERRVPFRVWALGAGLVSIVANLILLLHCPLTGRAHLLAGHLSIGLAWFVAVAGIEWGQRRATQT